MQRRVTILQLSVALLYNAGAFYEQTPMEETQLGWGKAEVNIKLSDAFRGRYALPIGFSVVSSSLWRKKKNKTKRGKKVKGCRTWLHLSESILQ